MSATVINMHDYIEALRLHVPPDIHPSTRSIIAEYLAEMHLAADDDPALVAKLAGFICYRVAQELRFEAENCESARDFHEAYRLRRQADRFEASHA